MQNAFRAEVRHRASRIKCIWVMGCVGSEGTNVDGYE